MAAVDIRDEILRLSDTNDQSNNLSKFSEISIQSVAHEFFHGKICWEFSKIFKLFNRKTWKLG